MTDVFVVFRIEKLKTVGNIKGAAQHFFREIPTINADPKRIKNNIIIKGPSTSSDVVSAVQKTISDNVKRKVRANAVLAVEAIVTASPDYFRPDNPHVAGAWDEKRLRVWREAIEPWIAQEFPHAASVILHLDESTPHYQIIDVPLVQDAKTGNYKLSCKEKYGGASRKSLAVWQDKAAEPVRHLGIQRGIPGSRATHTKINRYYGEMNQVLVDIPPLIPKPIPLPDAVFNEKIPFFSSKKERGKLEAVHAQESEAYKKNLIANQQARLKNFGSVYNRALGANRYKNEISSLQATVKKLNKKTNELNAQISELDAEIKALSTANRLRTLPLDDVLKKLYNAQLAPDGKETHSTKKYQIGNQEITVTPAKNGKGFVWMEQDGTGKRGAIDLVMHLDNCDYKEAVKMLGQYFAVDAIAAEHHRRLAPRSREEVVRAVAEPPELPDSKSENWMRVKKWLTNVRAIPVKLVNWLHREQLVYADERNNAVFPRLERPDAATLGPASFVESSLAERPFRTYGNNEYGPYVLKGNPNQLVLTAAPLDAISIKAVYPFVTAIATGENMLNPSDIKRFIAEDAQVFLAFNNDNQGEELSKLASEAWPNVTRLAPPKSKDWNEALQRGEFAYVDPEWLEVNDAPDEQDISRFGQRPQ